MQQNPLPLLKDSLYQLTFDFRADQGHLSDLSINLGDTAHPKFFGVAPFLMGPGYRPYTRLYLTGPEDETAELQFITASRAMLYLTNVNLLRVASLPIHHAYRLAMQAEDFSVIENPNYLPRAFCVDRVRSVGSYAEAQSALWEAATPLDLRQEALVQDLPQTAPVRLGHGEVEGVNDSQNHINLTARCAGTCFLVLTDAQYPGWKARVDGNEARIFTTNGVVRGLFLPDGRHHVSLCYFPASHGLGLLVTLLSAAVLVVITFRYASPSQKR